MFRVGKFKILKFFVITSTIQAGSLKNSKRFFWFLNIYGCLYLISIGILSYNLYNQFGDLLNSKNDSGGKRPNTNETTTNRTEDKLEDPFGGPPPDRGGGGPMPMDGGPDQNPMGPGPNPGQDPTNQDNGTQNDYTDYNNFKVVRFSETASLTLNNVVNLIMRIFGFFLFSKITKTYQSLIARQFTSTSNHWTLNETAAAVQIGISLLLQFQVAVAEVMQYSRWASQYLEFLEHTGKKSGSLSVFLHYFRWLFPCAFRQLASCFIAETYPIQCITFTLIIFTTLVTRNLEELSSCFECKTDRRPRGGDTGKRQSSIPDVYNTGTGGKRLNPIQEFNFCHELQAYYSNVRVKKSDSLNLHYFNPTSKNEVKVIVQQRKKSGRVDDMNTHFKSRDPFERSVINPELDVTAYLVRRYFEWFNLWREAQMITGVAALLIFLCTTVSLCVNSFMALSSAIDNGVTHLNTLSSILKTLLNVGRMFCLGNSAQFLLNAGEDLEEKIVRQLWKEEITSTISNSPSSSVHIRNHNSGREKQLSYLLHHMSQNPIGLSAFGFFTASRSTLTSIGGVIITYLVVLIQFKFS